MSMDNHEVVTIFIIVATLPYAIGDSSCKLSNSDNQDVVVRKSNSTSPTSTTPLTIKLMDRNDSSEDIEVFTHKNRVKGPSGRRGHMGTPIPPDGPGGPPKRVPPPPTTGSDTDAKLPGGSTQRTVDPRFTVPSTTRRRRIRTTPERISLEENCDYLAYYCLKAYNTGRVCTRTLYYAYYTFKNYCMMDYVNCMEGYEIWQIVHMGPCFNIRELTEYNHYGYKDSLFLEQDYVVDIV